MSDNFKLTKHTILGFLAAILDSMNGPRNTLFHCGNPAKNDLLTYKIKVISPANLRDADASDSFKLTKHTISRFLAATLDSINRPRNTFFSVWESCKKMIY